MPETHEPVTFENIKGLYRRGVYETSDYFIGEDETPKDHLCDGLNFQFYGNTIGTRYGAQKTLIAGIVIVRTQVYRRLGEAPRTILLDNTGKFYDSTNLAAPILNIPAATDFSGLNLFNRFFITPHNGTTGIAGEFVYIYDGTAARKALGAAPVGVLTLADGIAGSIEVGEHLICVAFETASGFITVPNTPQLYNAPGGKKLHVTNIPTGAAGVIVARRLIATQVITYNGNPLGFALFFVPNGRIADNVTTTLDIDFFDADLFNSADYLLDQLSELPACVGLTNFASRLITYGEDSQPNTARISQLTEPESFSASAGLITVDPTEAGGITNAIEFRSVLYLTKNTRTYATQDNGSDPDTWEVATVDKGTGTTCFGISSIFNNRGANLDLFVVADQKGLVVFNGIYQQPELTYKVEEIWGRINRNAMNKIQVYNDTQNRVLYASLPLDGATSCSHILVGYYLQGLNYQDIKWSLWQFPTVINSFGVSIDSSIALAKFFYTGNAGNIYTLANNQLTDDGTAINSFIRYYLHSIVPGWIHHFFQVVLRVWGNGTLNITMQGEDAALLTAIPSQTLAVPMGKEVNSRANFQNEKCSVKIGCNNGSDWFKVNHLILYAKALWNNRPQ